MQKSAEQSDAESGGEKTIQKNSDAELRYKTLFNQSPDGVLVIDSLGNFLDFNEAAHLQLGFSREEFERLRISDIDPVKGPEEIRAKIQHIIKNGGASFEVKHRTKTGEVRDVHVIYKPLTIAGRTVVQSIWRDITEQKRAEEALRAANVKLEALIQAMPDLVFVKDADGRYLLINNAGVESFGLAREYFIGKTNNEVLPPALAPICNRSDAMAIERGGPIHADERMIDKEGRERFFDTIKTPVYGSDGSLAGLICVARDDTDRRKAEEALQRSEDKFRTLFESANDAILIVSPDGAVIDANSIAYQRLGYPKEEFLSLHISRLHSPAFAGKVFEQLAMLKEEGHCVCESEHVTKDGAIVPVEINARMIDYDGRTAVFCIVRDITARKKAEEARVRSEKRFHALFDNMPLGAVIVDTKRRLIDCNASFQKMLGYSPDELKTLTVPQISQAADDLVTRDRYQAMMRGEIDNFAAEKRYIRKDGSILRANLTGTVMRDNEGKPQYFFGIIEDISERKKAEESLLLFKNLLNQSKDAIFVNDPGTGRFLIVNDRACDNLGYSRNELLTRGTLDIESIFPDRAAWDAHVAEVKSKGSLIVEGTHKRRDGTSYPAEVNVTYMTAGGRDYMVAVARDISERKTAEQALRKSEERLANAQKMAHVGNWEWNIVTNELYWSEEVYRIYGVDPERFVPTFDAVGKAMHPDDLDPFMKAVNAALYDRQPFEMDYRLIRPDGTERTVHTIGAVTFDAAGKPLVKGGTIQDITERKKMEEALRNSRDFIERILDTVDEAFIVIDRNFNIVLANNAYASQTSLPLQDIIGRHCYETSHRRSSACFEAGEECAVRRCFETGKPHSSVHKHVNKDGSLLFIETKAFPLKEDSGSITSVIEVIHNITDRHLLEEQMLRTQKLEAVGILAGGIAHDFNNLLQGVFGSISLAKTYSDRRGKAYTMLEGAESALYQATSLTNQLLTFSKGGEPIKKVLALPSVVDNAVKFALSGSNICYRSVVDERLRPVEADEGQLSQVIHNIVLNACDAMPDGGSISMEMHNVSVGEHSGLPLEKGDYVRVKITDSGAGIPDENLSKIFDPYFTTKRKGSGLGLATSYSIIKKHGGAITVHSQPGAGSTFSLYLPAFVGEFSTEKVRVTGSVPGKGKILVMDDEEIVRTVARYMLKELGYEACLADNGEQALEKFSEALGSGRPFDAVILDLTIRGGMGGKETLKSMAARDPSVRAIVSSGYSSDDVLSHYKEYGFQDVLSKPYEIEALSRVLQRLFPAEAAVDGEGAGKMDRHPDPGEGLDETGQRGRINV